MKETRSIFVTFNDDELQARKSDHYAALREIDEIKGKHKTELAPFKRSTASGATASCTASASACGSTRARCDESTGDAAYEVALDVNGKPETAVITFEDDETGHTAHDGTEPCPKCDEVFAADDARRADDDYDRNDTAAVAAKIAEGARPDDKPLTRGVESATAKPKRAKKAEKAAAADGAGE